MCRNKIKGSGRKRMSEKVLGFKETEEKEKYFMGKEWAILVKRKNLVPVVSVEEHNKQLEKAQKAFGCSNCFI